jgi:hypothetical protein
MQLSMRSDHRTPHTSTPPRIGETVFEAWCTEPALSCGGSRNAPPSGVMTWAYAGQFSGEKEKLVGAVRRAQAALHNLGNASISSSADELVHISTAENTCASIRRFAGSLQGCTELCLANARCKKAVRRLYCTTNWACHGKHELQLDRFTQEYIHTVVRAKVLDTIRFNFNFIVEHLISRLKKTITNEISTDQAGEVSIGYLRAQPDDCVKPQSGDNIVPQSGQMETHEYDDDGADDTDEYNVHEVDWGHKVNVRVHSQHPASIKWYNALLRWCKSCVKCCTCSDSLCERGSNESTGKESRSTWQIV